MEKLIIIGSGPAGLTAAIYAARGGLNPLVVSGREAGGQLMLTTDVDDYPGFEEGIQGPDLMVKMRKQAERFATRFINEDVVSVDFSRRPFVVKTESLILNSNSLILSTGASAMWLGLASEQRLIGKGVSSCAVCDGFFFKDKNVIVVGGGDSAMREAAYLSKLCKKVTVVHRRDKLRAQVALQELVKSKKNVDFIWNSVIEEILGQEKVSGVKLKNTQTGEISQMQIDGVFIAIGHKPNTDFLKGQLDLDEKGYVVVENETHTKIPGVFVAGDMADYHYRQAVTAAGMGCKSAMDVEEYLENQKFGV
ncbi:MAG: thioredoxin reductase (NADPH) [Microgenomates group bacterium Gr01-1014_7]|nr:MAG: thioredoxin reductase (NADPH) [Microgenomates group bacterium Gr01-1014_7]